MRVWLPLIVLLPIVAMACRDFEDRTGSSGLVNGSTVSAAGIWQGNWTTLIGSGDSGGVSFILEQDDDANVFGCSCWTGSACWDDGVFSGTNLGASILPIVMEVYRDPPPPPRLNAIRVTARLDLIGDLATGTFAVVADDLRRCTDSVPRTGDEGTLELNREDLSGIDVEALCDELAAAANCVDALP